MQNIHNGPGRRQSENQNGSENESKPNTNTNCRHRKPPIKEHSCPARPDGRPTGSLGGLLLHLCAIYCLLDAVRCMEYSAKLSNCYDIKYGFDEHRNNGTAPKRLLNVTVAGSRNDGGRGSDGSRGNATGNGTTTMLNELRLLYQRDQQEQQQQQQQSKQQQQQYKPQQLVTTTEMMPGTIALLPSGVSPSISGWKCCCWNATNQDEVECRCEGEALTRIPQTLTVPLQRLTIASAGLPRLRSAGLKLYGAYLLDIVLTDLKYLECIEDGAFAGLKQLRTIYISHAPQLTHLSKDVFEGISDAIKIIRIINSGLTTVPDLIHLPPENILQMIDLDNNHITRIDMKSIRIKTDQLILANNDISYIDDSAFYGSQIAKLILKENHNLRQIHPNAFNGMSSMQELDLSSTSLVRLPSVGLQDIEELYIENTHTLKTIPSIYNFKNLQRAYLTHSFHCCAFKYPSRHDPRRHAERMKEIEKWQKKCIKNERTATTTATDDDLLVSSNNSNDKRWSTEAVESSWNIANSQPTAGAVYSRWERSNAPTGGEVNETESLDYLAEDDYLAESMSGIGVFHDEITIDAESNQLDEYCGNFTFSRKHDVECYPAPNALNPCEDVMGYSLLRTSVWIVVALAVVGNVAVLVVILSIRSESPSVPRFLMCHLAFADLCLGLYLLLIASIDAHSMGEYFNYAYDWQYGAGCKLAGFLTVFASHLSVFTLTVITIERWLAITHAMYLNRRIKLRAAAYIMVCGWIYSIVMSLLPLFGISNYSSTSICLPMEIRDPFDIIYLVSVLGLNGVAFFIIAICYAQIYLSLGQETRHSTHPGEMSVAKKMALLVFTNFACWAPIAFFGLTALGGFPLINVTKSKILLVFFYPLNSCADPYLYAILTSQYRQDLYTLLSKLGICKKTVMKYKDSISIPGNTNITMHGSMMKRPSSSSTKSLQHKSPETQIMLKSHEDFV